MPNLDRSSCRNSGVSWNVYRMIGACGRIARKRGAASRPCMMGIERSRITALGLTLAASSSARAPFSACTHELNPEETNASHIACLTWGLSSTMRTDLCCGSRLAADGVGTPLRNKHRVRPELLRDCGQNYTIRIVDSKEWVGARQTTSRYQGSEFILK